MFRTALKSAFSGALDASVYFSFDASGYRRHARQFRDEDLQVDLSAKVCLVTGANSGIGEAAAAGLLERGATVYLLCRNEERGKAAQARLRSDRARLALIDLANPASVRAFVAEFEAEKVDVLVNNAGVLLDSRQVTEDGHERTWATNVLGPFLLTKLLLPKLQDGGRVINVSSGGMYTQRMSLKDLDWSSRPFDGVVAYAQTKRAEVILTERWAEELAPRRIWVNAMHPGWVDTPGVETSLPKFYRWTKDRLRSPKMGADTIVWLACAPRLDEVSGRFWFDRAEAPTHKMAKTQASQATRDNLWALCEAQCS